MIVNGTEIRIQGKMIRIARPDADKFQFLENPEKLLAGLKQSGTRIDLFTFVQTMPDTAPKFGYPMEWDNLAVMPVSTFEHWWSHQIRSYPRNRARQAGKRGVTFRELELDESLVKGIWEIYNETPVRQGRPFPHYGKDIETVRKEASTYLDSSFYIGAFYEGVLIGFAKLTCDQRGTQANLMNILAMVRHREKAPTNALIAEAVRLCETRKISYLVYQNYFYGNKQQDTLTKFKENNGFQCIEVPRYYIPLTSLGRGAFRLGLHHKLVDRFPERLAAKLRDLRSAWYHKKFPVTSEAL
jgi:hypothetical protein